VDEKFNFVDLNQKAHNPLGDEKIDFRPGVYVIVKNERNQILMVMESEDEGWELPGGGLEIGEEIFDCAKRELWKKQVSRYL